MCVFQPNGLPSSISCLHHWPKPRTWMLNIKIEKQREKHMKEFTKMSHLFKNKPHSVRFMEYRLSRRRFKKYMSGCYFASKCCLLFKPVFAWPRHHGNEVTQLTLAKFHLIAPLACHLALIVIFNFI